MNDFLIIGDRREYFNYFYNHFRHLQIHFSWMDADDNFVLHINREKTDMILFVGMDVEKQLEWIQRIRDHGIQIPYVCFTAKMHWKNRETLWQAGVVDIIHLPILKSELERILYTWLSDLDNHKDEDQERMRGVLRDFHLLDLIQSFEGGKKNVIIKLENGIRKGHVFVKNGKVIDAQYEQKDALEALAIMASWFNGYFDAHFTEVKQRERLKLDNQQMIMECMNAINEQNNLSNQLPPENQLLYAAPDIDYEEMGPNDRNRLLSFKEGNTLRNFFDSELENPVLLMKKMLDWCKKEWLIPEEEYRKRLKHLEEEKQKSGIKKMVERIFKKEEESHLQENESEDEDPMLREMQKQIHRRPYAFHNLSLLKKFEKELEHSS